MKNNLIGSGMLIGVVGIAIYFAITSESSVEYNSSTSTSTVETVEVEEEELDVVEESRKELERINNELDQEEQKLLEERQAVDARLEEINSIRASFQ